MGNLFKRNILEHLEVMGNLYHIEQDVEQAISVITECFGSGKKLLICGNGGSAADSQHIAAEFTGRFIHNRKPLPAIALSTDSSALTCISNDYSYEDVFSRQLEAIGREGDCLLGISTSGNSKNVLKAVSMAKQLKIKSICFLGRDGGILAEQCDIPIIVASDVTARIQEAHILIGHTICGGIEQELDLVACL